MAMPKAPRPQCQNCGAVIDIPPSRAKRRKWLFCSEPCRQAALSKRCVVCGRPFYAPKSRSGQRACSPECGHKLQGRSISGSGNPAYRKVSVSCAHCGLELLRSPSRVGNSRQQFCSFGCRSEYRSIHENGPRSPRWRGGVGRSRHTTWAKRVKQAAGSQCQQCGARPPSVKLHAHHTAGYAPEYDGPISIKDGQCLCTSCHIHVHVQMRKAKKIALNSEVELDG